MFSGVTGNQTNKDPVTIKLRDPITIGGEYSFRLRGLVEAAGGAANPITAKIVLNVEFHSD